MNIPARERVSILRSSSRPMPSVACWIAWWELVRFFVCPDCSDPVPDGYVKRLREKGKLEFNCPCGGTVSLAEPKERIHFKSKVEAMEQSADRQRDFDGFVMSAKARRARRVSVTTKHTKYTKTEAERRFLHLPLSRQMMCAALSGSLSSLPAI